MVEFLSFSIWQQCLTVLLLISLFVLLVSAFITGIIGLKEAWKDERFEQEQMTLLPLLFPFMTDKNMWYMHESGQHLKWRNGHFSLTVTPSGFNKRYRLCLWLDDRTEGESKLLELLFNGNGCIRKTLLTCLISSGMSDDLSRLPFHETIESVLDNVSNANIRSSTTQK